MVAVAFNDKGRTVAAPTVESIDEALGLAYAWNSDELRPDMIVTSVLVKDQTFPIAVQLGLF